MDQVDQIKQKLNIVDVVGSYIDLKKSGSNYKALCPFHSEKTSSFMVSPELQIFKCFGCNQSGDVFSFVQKIDGVEFPQALEQLAERAGITLVRARIDPEKSRKNIIYEINHLSAEFYNYVLLNHKIGKKALDYLTKNRKLTPKAIHEFKLGYAPDSWDSLFKFLSGKKYSVSDMLAAGVVIQGKTGSPIDKFRGRAVFPLFGIDGNVLGFMGRTIFDREPKYLNTGETLVFHKGAFLYGLDKARVSIKREGAVFVEGPVDVVNAHQMDITNVIATSGTALTTAQLKIISRYTSDITFCFDSDTAGFTAMSKAIELSEKENLNARVAIIPQDYKDLDEYLNAAGADKVKELTRSAVPIYDFFIASALKKYDRYDSIGKKKITQEVVPWFSKIGDPVVLSHYVKKLSEVVGVDEGVISSLVKGGSSSESFETKYDAFEVSKMKGKSLQEYMVTLLLKAPLDTAQTLLYKLGQKDFTDDILGRIFVNLKDHLLGRKRRFDIKRFSNRLDDDLKKVVMDLYLWDIGDFPEDDALFERELNAAFARVKQDTIKRELRELSAKIKDVELENDADSMRELSERFKELSQKLL